MQTQSMYKAPAPSGNLVAKVELPNLFSKAHQIITRLQEANETLATTSNSIQEEPSNEEGCGVPPQPYHLLDLLEDAASLVAETSRLAHSIAAKVGNHR